MCLKAGLSIKYVFLYLGFIKYWWCYSTPALATPTWIQKHYWHFRSALPWGCPCHLTPFQCSLQWHLHSPGNWEVKIKLLPRPDSTYKLHMILLLKLCKQLLALLLPFLDSGNLQLGIVFMWPIWSSVLNTLSFCIHKQKVGSFHNVFVSQGNKGYIIKQFTSCLILVLFTNSLAHLRQNSQTFLI